MTAPALFQRRLSWDDARAFEKSSVEFFVLEDPDAAALPLRVVSVKERPPVAGGRQFTIVFRGPLSPVLPQRTYRVRHPSLGDFPIFVTPIGQAADSTDYEACFAHVA
jgi:hypothetical protein